MSSLQVIIPAYNVAQYIAETLHSVLQQECKDFAVMVVDNASTDETEQVVRSFGQQVKYVRNEVNIGSIRNHNRALSLATADYVKLLSADDVLMPGMLAEQKAVLDKFPEVGVVTCNGIITDSALNRTGEIMYLPGYWKGRNAVRQCARRLANLIGAPSNTMFRRAYVKDSAFDPELKWMGDLDFACQVLSHSDFYNIDKFGFKYRRHDATDSLLSCPAGVRLHDELAFARKYGGGLPALSRIVYRQAKHRLKAAKASAAVA